MAVPSQAVKADGHPGSRTGRPLRPQEFKADAVRVARRGDLTQDEIAVDFGISEDSVRHWLRQADVDDGVKDRLNTSEQSEDVQMRRKIRRLEMENESSPLEPSFEVGWRTAGVSLEVV